LGGFSRFRRSPVRSRIRSRLDGFGALVITQLPPAAELHSSVAEDARLASLDWSPPGISDLDPYSNQTGVSFGPHSRLLQPGRTSLARTRTRTHSALPAFAACRHCAGVKFGRGRKLSDYQRAEAVKARPDSS
jgi:hypothetical protein